jgi:hypothetical protein
LTFDSARGAPKITNSAIKPQEAQVLAALARQPANLKLLAADRASTVADRQACVDRIKALDAEAEIDWPKGQRAIGLAVAKCREAERKLREACDTLFAANAAAAKANLEYTNAREAEEATLLATADIAAIDGWKKELLDEFAALQRAGLLVSSESIERDPVTRRTIRRRFSNAANIAARMAAVRETFRAIDLLKFEPDQTRLPTIFAAARASWPKVDSPVAEPTPQ